MRNVEFTKSDLNQWVPIEEYIGTLLDFELYAKAKAEGDGTYSVMFSLNGSIEWPFNHPQTRFDTLDEVSEYVMNCASDLEKFMEVDAQLARNYFH